MHFLRLNIQQSSSWRQSRGQPLWPHPSALDFWAGLCLTGVNIARWLEQRINTDVEEALLATDWPHVFPWSVLVWTTMHFRRDFGLNIKPLTGLLMYITHSRTKPLYLHSVDTLLCTKACEMR